MRSLPVERVCMQNINLATKYGILRMERLLFEIRHLNSYIGKRG